MDNIIVWFGLCLIPAIWFLQNVIHETSHIIIPWLKGCEVKIYPWPKRTKERFYMAYSEWKCPQKITSKKLQVLIYAFPRLVDLAIIGVILPIHPESAWVNTALVVWQVAAFTDFAFNTVGVFRPTTYRNDAWTTMLRAGFTNVKMIRIWSVVAVLAVGSLVAIRAF